MAITYSEVLARNIRSARARLGIDQEPAAERMRTLGYGTWVRQTIGEIEKGRRRVTADEILGLSFVLETTIPRLMAPVSEDGDVDGFDRDEVVRRVYGH
jgi:transcriptional regulator with XRE-family HTH domain